MSCDGSVDKLKQCIRSIELLQEVHHEDKLMSTFLPSLRGRVLDNINNAWAQSKGLGTKRGGDHVKCSLTC